MWVVETRRPAGAQGLRKKQEVLPRTHHKAHMKLTDNIYMYMYIYIYVMCVYIYIYIYTHIGICIYTCISSARFTVEGERLAERGQQHAQSPC